jgi:hypothetical protein
MYDKFLSEGNNNQYLSGEEGISPLDPNSEEFQEMKFLFNTIVNDMSQKQNSPDQKIYGIETGFSLKNQYISLNFEKREMKEITSYGWYASEDQDEKKFLESLTRLKRKGQDKVGFDINVSPLSSGEELNFVFICKFIIGECYILFQGDQLEQTKEELAEKYDTIVKISENKTKKYEILKPENIELLYLVKLTEPNFEPKTIQCQGPNCKSNEQGIDSIQTQEKKICYCLLSDTYLCKSCHAEYHQNNILFGEFGTENCEQKPFINNYQGECQNKQVHPNNETIEFFCKDCNRGICSFCRFNSNEKHQDLHLITNLFNSCSLNDKNSSFREIKESFNQKTRELSKRISECQKNNQNAAKKLVEIILIGFNKMFRETNDSFTREGEKLLGICYQLNYLRDCLVNFDKLYVEREALLKSTKLKQELFWTKKTHFANLLFLINVKEYIKTAYKIEEKNFEKFINKYKKMFHHPISVFLMDEQDETKKEKTEKQESKITANFLLEELQVNKNKLLKKK